MDRDGRIPAIEKSVEHPERWRYIPEGRLKPGMFSNVELTSARGSGLVVPRDAVVDTGRAQYAFVALRDGYFDPRAIRTGQAFDGEVEVVEGLAEDEVVASGATFFIDSESQLRAAMQGFEAAPAPTPAAGPRG